MTLQTPFIMLAAYRADRAYPTFILLSRERSARKRKIFAFTLSTI